MGSFMDKMSNSFFGKHYRIERFGVMVISILLLMFVLGGVCLRTSMIKNKNTRAAQAIYTTAFATSRTGVTGTVVDIYKSEDGKGCMVMLKFDNISRVSADANNYQLFLTAASSAEIPGNPRHMTSAPSGSIYMFGLTGYMGVYLYSETGFGDEVLDLVIRCNSELVPVQKASTVSEDASFDKFDQLRIYFNPSGTDATVASCLNDNNFTLFNVYAELICKTREREIHDLLDTDLANMYANLEAIKEYENRLNMLTTVDGYHVVALDRPEYIKGDAIEKDENGDYVYTCEMTAPRGLNFEWRNGSVIDGYLSALLPEGMSYSKWLSNLNKQEGRLVVPKSTDWYLSDGTSWADYGAYDMTGSAADINATITALTTEYQNYFTNKQLYQVTHLRSLIDLESEARSVEMNYTINTSEDVLRLY